HLRCGNSLIGTRFADLQKGTIETQKKSSKKAQAVLVQGTAAAQPMLFDEESLRLTMTTAVDMMWLIESSQAQTVAEVKEQEQLYSSLSRKLIDTYDTLANLACAIHFGLAIDSALWKSLTDYVTGRNAIAFPQFDSWLQTAAAFSEQYHFFHWELEFPEVFFDRFGQQKGAAAGFDVVIGNPPYVRQEELGQLKTYFAVAYPETYRGVADLYVYFYQQGLHLTRSGGRMSYIVTNKWMRAGYGEPLRAFFAKEGVLSRIIDFGHAPIFEDADVFPCILVLAKPVPELEQSPLLERDVRVLSFPREELGKVNMGRYIQEYSHSLPQSRFSNAAWNLEVKAVDQLLEKIRRIGVPLAEFAHVKPFYGIKTGLNEAFLIDTPTKNRLIRDDPGSAEIIKPYLRGQDIKRWSPEWADLWMIFTRRGIDIDAYPAIKKHLLQFYEQLQPKPKDWRGGDWSGRKPGSCQWYEIQDAVDYWPLFERPKIMYQEIQFHPSYCFDTSSIFSNNKVFFLPTSDAYLLAVLNSPLMWWHNWRYLPHMKDEALSPVGVLMATLPVALPTEVIHAEVEEIVARLMKMRRTGYEMRRLMLDWLRT
ncbi:MAG TPA: Eco57I restriction-modification methylase domain-containing protein, partial [Ktedonobacteraceae bacterium]|nr:Eco57I restriction-modification methylase domain-containing protein [Ktedonobacteraceae bacterium]